MAQSGYTPISTYYSATASSIPLAANLVAGELALNTNDGKLYYKNSGNVVTLLASSAGASGDVVGPASSTDNALARFDTTTGKLIQNSVGLLSDAGILTGLTGVTSSGPITLSSLTSTRLTFAGVGGLLSDSANLTWDGSYLSAASIKDAALTSGRVPYAGTAGLLQDSANLTFNGTTLTAAGFSGPISGVVTSTSITDSGLTSGRVTYAGASGLLQDSANLTFNGTTLTANTIGAFTLGGTVAGGGNQLNNVIIGTTTPLAGAFTTLSASSTATLSGLTASTALALDASKNIVSVTNTGSGNNVLATSPTITGATLTTSAFNGTVGATTPSTGAFTTLSATGQISGTNTASYQAIFSGWGPLESNSTAGAIVVGGSSQNSGRGEIHYWYNSSPAPALYIDNTRNTTDGKVVVRLKTFGTAVEAATFNIYGIGLTGATPSSGTGITFPATQSASTDANTLDDYEEGTWTPTQGAGLTVVGTFSSIGRYTKIGDTVFIEGKISASTSLAFTSGAVCGGLPFSASSTYEAMFSGGNQNSNATAILASAGTSLYAQSSMAATLSYYFSGTYKLA